MFKSLLRLGINPAGPKPSTFYDLNGGYWYNLFDFNSLGSKEGISNNAQEFRKRIVRWNKIEQMASIFSNKNRSFEELRLGYLAPTTNIQDKQFYEYVCSVIRIMGEKKKIKDLPHRYYVSDSFPKQVRQLTKKVFGVTSNADISEKHEELRLFLEKGDIPAGRTMLGLSALPSTHPLNVGMLGMHGNYAPNIKEQECDVLHSSGYRP